MEILQIVLAAIVGLGVSFGVIKKWKKLNWKQKGAAIIGIGLTIVTAWNGVIELNKKDFLEKINASYGDIEDIQDATLPAIGVGMKDNAPLFVTNEVGTFNLIVNNVLLKNLLKAYIKNNRLYVNMVVYDSTGLPALGIFENT